MNGPLDAFSPTSDNRNVLSPEDELTILRARVEELERKSAERKWMDDALKTLAFGTATATGQKFLQQMVRQLSAILRVPYVFVTEFVPGRTDRVRTVAGWCCDEAADSIEYALHGSPCEKVFQEGLVFLSRHVQQRFPQDEYLITLNIESYMGAPLLNGTGQPTGHLCVMDVRPFCFDHSRGSAIIKIFAERAAAELERLRAEETLRQSEERFRALYEHNPTMYFTLTPDGTVLSVNRFGAEELGYRENELVGQSVLAVFQSADHQTVLGQLIVCSQSPGRTFDWEIQKVRKGGQRLWVKERARAITGPDGSPIILIVCEDITDQRQAEAARTRSEERLRSFLNALDDLAFELDEHGVYLNVWTRNDDLLLLPKQEIVGKTLNEIHGPQAGDYYRAVIHRVLDSGTPESVEYSLHLKGHLRHFAAILSRIPAGADHSPTVAAIIRETTRQKLAEESARELNLALSNAMPGIARLNRDGCYVTINTYYASALGYDPDELIGRSWTPTVHADDLPLVAQAFDQLQTHGKGECEARGLRKDGSTFFNQVLLVRIDDAAGTMIGHHCFMRDITDRKRAELALHESKQAIRALLEATSASGLTLDQRIHSVLALGCRQFRLPIGLMTKAEGDQLVITHAWDPDRRFTPGMHLPLCQSYCGKTLTETQPVAIDHAGQSEWRTHPGYQTLGLESYLGTKLVGEHQIFGTICFLSPAARPAPFTPAERDFLLLMARWVSGELDRHKSEQALRISEERFEIAFRSSPHPVIITELATGRCIEVNDTALQLFGFQRHEAVGHTTIAIELWPTPGDRVRFITQLLETGTLRGVEFTFQTKDHRLRHCLVSSELIELNGMRCILTVGTDVTEKKEAQAALRESEARWQRFVADAPVGLVIVDADKRILSANKAFCTLTGYSEQEVINNTYALYTHPDDLPKNLALTDEFFAGQRQAYTYEKRYIRKNGEIIWVSIRASHLTVRGHDTPLLLAVVEDITDRKHAVVERERISQDLHDNILQSLYAVGMQLEAGRLLAGKAPRKSKQHVTQAIRQLNHLVLEVRQFITDLTSRTASTLDFSVALNQLVASCSSETRTAPALDLDPTALTAVTPAIGEQLLNIAREALSNSVRHARATHRSVSLTKTDRAIRLCVADDGRGFDPSRKRRLGHGLANMAARARTIGAQFTLASEPDRGTSITIDVPTGDPHAC